MSNQPSTSAGTENPSLEAIDAPAARSSSANFTSMERCRIISACLIAQTLLDVDQNTIPKAVFAKFCEILEQSRFKDHIPHGPTIQSLRRLIKKFNNGEDVMMTHKGGRHRAHHEEIEYMIKSTGLSSRCIAEELTGHGIKITQRTVCNVARRNGIGAFRKIVAQPINAEQVDKRLQFCQSMLHLISEKKCDPDDIIFTDEAIVRIGCGADRQKDRVRRSRGDHGRDRFMEQDKLPIGVHMFCATHKSAGIIGPFFIKDITCELNDRDTLTAPRYKALLKDLVFPELERRLTPEQWDRCWWQQDGAEPLRTASNLAFIKSMFGDRIIAQGAGFAHDWSPDSPDLSVCEYYFWNLLKTIIRQKDPFCIEEIKFYLNAAARTIESKHMDQLANAYADFVWRLKACVQKNGVHFEQSFKSFKRYNRVPIVCSCCDREHLCDCDECDILCMEKACEGWFEPRCSR